MLTKNQIKFIQSLDRKKCRVESGCFLAEGNKLVEDTLHAFECRMLVATPQWWEQHAHVQADVKVEASRDELSRVSQLTTPQDVLAVYVMPQRSLDMEQLHNELSLVLDTVQDPGNLGTIIRIADWMGIRHIICSPETADVYNPKVVQATMGALARVHCHYVDNLAKVLAEYKAAGYPIYGTLLEGQNMYHKDSILTKERGIIVMGNEGNGISQEVRELVTHPLLIPSYPADGTTSESLNVSIATAIVLAEFRRNNTL